MSVEATAEITNMVNEILHKVETFQGVGSIEGLKLSIQEKKPITITGKNGAVELELLTATIFAYNSKVLIVEVLVLQSASPEYIIGQKYGGTFRLP